MDAKADMGDGLRSDLLMELSADLEEGLPLANTPRGDRRIVYVKGGRFEGARLKGDLLPGGGDWFLMRPDGVGELDVRATLRTHDGHLIYATYRGLVHGKFGTPDFYFRITPYYETGSEKYGWLNRIVAVGVGTVTEQGVAYKVYEIL